jgi:HK97 gp10 family phage protein
VADALLRQTSFADFRITVRNQAALIANLHRFGDESLSVIHEVTRVWAEDIQQLAIELAPYWVNDPPPPHHPGFLKAHIRLVYSEGGFAFEIGCWTEDFDAIGENNYAIFQEYGTSQHGAQPFLNPAYNWGAPKYVADVTRVIRELAAEANR